MDLDTFNTFGESKSKYSNCYSILLFLWKSNNFRTRWWDEELSFFKRMSNKELTKLKETTKKGWKRLRISSKRGLRYKIEVGLLMIIIAVVMYQQWVSFKSDLRLLHGVSQSNVEEKCQHFGINSIITPQIAIKTFT
jgi:hypothetical protein